MSYHLLDVRVASFAAVTKPKSKAKPAWPLSSSTHPLLTPSRLASAGFYHDPDLTEADSLDRCRCFVCDMRLGGWDETDDPFLEHAKRGGCAWAENWCQPRYDLGRHEKGDPWPTFASSEDLPSSSDQCAVRAQTYGTWWPHEGKRGWKPTIQSMAAAGFVFTPEQEAPDQATCPYCNYAADGWEAKDDPIAIHKSKRDDCRFFTAKVADEDTRAKQSKPSRKAAIPPTPNTETQVDANHANGTTTKPSAPPPMSDDGASEAGASAIGESSSRGGRRGRGRGAVPGRTRGGRRKGTVRDDEPDGMSEIAAEPAPGEDDPTGTIHSTTSTQQPEVEIPKRRPGRPKKVHSATVSLVPKEVAQVDGGIDDRSRAPPEDDDTPKAHRAGRPEPVESPQPPRPQSALDRFATLPISSDPIESPARPVMPVPKARSQATPPSLPAPPPIATALRPSAKATSVPTRSAPAPAKPQDKLPRDAVERSTEAGAKAARRVMEDLAASPALNRVSKDDGPSQPPNGDLDEAQLTMTLEEFVHAEFKTRHDRMKREGEDMISRWEEAARDARKAIGGI